MILYIQANEKIRLSETQSALRDYVNVIVRILGRAFF